MRRLVATAVLALSTLLLPLVAQVTFAYTLPAGHAQYVQRVVELINIERQRVGLAPVRSNPALTYAAQRYAEVMADSSCFGHDCGSTLGERYAQAGYLDPQAWAENIAAGQLTPDAVMTSWMSSGGHRSNILGDLYQDTGVGLAATSSGRFIWVLNLGRPPTGGGIPPTPTPVTPTPTPAPIVQCSPRPKFQVGASRSAQGVLDVTVAAGRSGGAADNTLRSVRFDSLANSTVDVSGWGRVTSGTTVTMAPGTVQATFTLRRAASGAASTVQLVLTDACGQWSTFVGGGPAAF